MTDALTTTAPTLTYCPMGDDRLSSEDNPLCPQHRDLLTLVEQGLRGTNGKRLRKILNTEEDRWYKALMRQQRKAAKTDKQYAG